MSSAFHRGQRSNAFLSKENAPSAPQVETRDSAASAPDVDKRDEIPATLPILPIRNAVLFPGIVTPLTIARETSKKMLEEVLPQSKVIGVFTQQNSEQEEPALRDLYTVGVAATVLKMFRQPDESVVIVANALERIAWRRAVSGSPYLRAEVEVLRSTPPPANDKQWQATVQSLQSSALQLLQLNPEVQEQARLLIMNIEDVGHLTDFLASSLNLDLSQKQNLLEELDVVKRVRAVQERISAQLEIAQLQQKIQKDVASQFTDAQRRAYLREQIRAIQRELGEGEEGSEVRIEQMRTRLREVGAPEVVLAQAEREFKRLALVPSASPEFSVIASYVETLTELPWSKQSVDNLDLKRARAVLDRDHFGLEKVKRRLTEYLAVRKLNPSGHSPILCFVGPPGVGKTSLGQSVADALGREFSRLSLGGVRDEAEIRGHRRTYIGAMPGRIVQELRRLGTRNPVMMLDEVDKLGVDFRGDPSSALLEVLDPWQNHSFVDHYLEVPFDLSQVLFIATANYLDPVPPALRDRMEVIEITGYTDHEKLEIARRYIVRRQLKENGLKERQCQFGIRGIQGIITDYTHEAGVRGLERQIGAVCRAIAAEIAEGIGKPAMVGPERIREILGPPKYIRETKLKTRNPGVVTGLAWTPAGGEVLHVEALRYPGKGNIMLTGQIGDVMKESAQAALSLLRSRVTSLGLLDETFKNDDIHIHVPAGAVPKDGPSAGVAMFTALASLFCNASVKPEVAMTGEISLRGLVLPVGGLKEKCLAAARAGIRKVIVPKLNENDLSDIPPEIRSKLEFVLVETVEELITAALGKSMKATIHKVVWKHERPVKS